MAVTSGNYYILIVIWIFFVIVVGGLIQARLSKKQEQSMGLILPTITFVLATILLLIVVVRVGGIPNFAEYIVDILIYFILFNIPTILYLIIYFVCRKSVEANKEIEKMNIMDLE